MDKLLEISEYMENLNLKKAIVGGYDRKDVDAKLAELQEMLIECQEQQEEQERMLEDYDFRLQTSRTLVRKLKRKVRELLEEQENQKIENEKMKDTYKEYCSNILQQYSESLRVLSTEFSEILDNITNLQKNIIDADSIEELETRLEEEALLEAADVLPGEIRINHKRTEKYLQKEAQVQTDYQPEVVEFQSETELEKAEAKRPRKRRRKVEAE